MERDGVVDAGTVLRWALVVLVLLLGAGLTYAVWQLESSYLRDQGNQRGGER